MQGKSFKTKISISFGVFKMKVLSYSLYGNDDLYCIGAIKNAQQAINYYPNWMVYIWHDKTVPDNILSELKNMPNVKLLQVVDSNTPGRYWRFNLFNDKNVEIFCVRDTDSRISQREIDAVNEWLDSPQTMHVMRDHPNHNYLVMAGMWGFKNKIHIDFKQKLENWLKSKKIHEKIDDTLFLYEIYRDVDPHVIVHDDWKRCKNSKNFPKKRTNQRFVGEIIGPNDQPAHDHHMSIIV